MVIQIPSGVRGPPIKTKPRRADPAGLAKITLVNAIRLQPETGTKVTVPTDAPFSVNAPPAVTATVAVELAEEAAPNSNATLRGTATPLATAPVVRTLKEQGFTVTVWPGASE